jgi:Transposase, Mutator family/Transposase
VRAVALDVHRDFCEVAIVTEGRLRSAGRIATTPEALELFAQSLDPRDRVALEVTGNAWAIARILEPHAARVIVVSPSDTGIRQARAKTDPLDARALAKLLWAGLLPEEALQDALKGLEGEEITGPGGLLSQLAGRVIQTALETELTDHLGHPPGGVPAGANVRNGSGAKTVSTDLGPVEVRTPRDRDGSFEPQLVAKRQTRRAGLDDKILGLYAGGMSVRDISAHLTELYATEIGRDTVSRITDAVLEDVAAWRSRPLERVYPIVYFDAMFVKVREDRSVKNRACYLALGVTCDGA